MPRERCKYSGMIIKGGKNDWQGQVGGGVVGRQFASVEIF